MKKLFFLFALVFSFSTAAMADDCVGAGTSLYFANGMFNTEREAFESLQALRKAVPGRNFESDPARLKFKLAYNHNEKWWRQLFQVARQKFGSDFRAFWLALRSHIPMPESFKKDYLALIQDVGLLVTPKDSDLETHIRSYQDDIDHRRRVIVVSHSQGNFYAVNARLKLDFGPFGAGDREARFGYGNLQIATPIGGGEAPWLTFEDDRVISLLRKFFDVDAPHLPAIGSGPPPLRDPFGHNFIKAYLETPESRQMIEHHLKKLARTVEYPTGAGFGIGIGIKAPRDSGLGFYLRHPDGKRFDFDESDKADGSDQSLFYSMVACNRLQEGTYQFGIDTMFADSSIQSLVLDTVVKAGESALKFAIPLRKRTDEELIARAREDEDDAPVAPLLAIRVRKGVRGYQFRIESRHSPSPPPAAD